MKHLLVIAVLCMLLVGVGGVASLALTTPVVGPAHGTGTHPPSRAYDLIGWNKQGPFEKVGKIYFDVPHRTFEAEAHLDPSATVGYSHPNQGVQQVRGDVTVSGKPYFYMTLFGGCGTPDKTGKVRVQGTLSDDNVQFLSKYQNTARYWILAGCIKK